MELEKYIEKTKNAIDAGYHNIQDALMKRDESLKSLKDNGWQYSEEKYSKLYHEIITTFDTETQSAVADCKAAIQEQKGEYMKEVSICYTPDGSKLDLNDMNLIKSGIPMTLNEIYGMIEKHSDNPTMLRIVEKYAAEQKMLDKIRDHSVLHAKALIRAKNAGKTEERIFDRFVHLASMGMIQPNESFTLYQSRLNMYEENAVLDLLKAKLLIDDVTQEKINAIEKKQMDERNEANKGKTWGTLIKK